MSVVSKKARVGGFMNYLVMAIPLYVICACLNLVAIRMFDVGEAALWFPVTVFAFCAYLCLQFEVKVGPLLRANKVKTWP